MLRYRSIPVISPFLRKSRQLQKFDNDAVFLQSPELLCKIPAVVKEDLFNLLKTYLINVFDGGYFVP